MSSWQEAQTRTFTKWVQNQLTVAYKDQAPVVRNLFVDLQNGVVLIKLFAALFGKFVPVSFAFFCAFCSFLVQVRLLLSFALDGFGCFYCCQDAKGLKRESVVGHKIENHIS
jgi:hypothetical protein